MDLQTTVRHGLERLRGHVSGHLGTARMGLQEFAQDDPRAGRFRAEQLRAVMRLTPLTMLANGINAGLICLTFWHNTNHWMLAGWAAVVLLVLAQGTRAWWTKQHLRTTASPRAIRRATVHAGVLGLVWAAVPLALFGHADGEQRLLISGITTGMICAGGFALATLPMAATAFVTLLSAAGAAALLQSDLNLGATLSLLLACYGIIVLASVWTNARVFLAHLVARADAEQHDEVVGLLLRDFEENASDLLWEIDARGHLCHVSAKLLAAFARPVDRLTARPALELLEGMQSRLPEDQRPHLGVLRQHLDRGLPFKDVTLPLPSADRTRWWSLTAKPLFDERGGCTGWRGVATDVTEAQRANHRLTFLANFDALTGLANRHQLRATLADLLTPEHGLPQSCAVLCLDLDHFKSINDTLGHAIGDDLLREVARRLLAGIRHSDTAARLGGDEFVVILHHVKSRDEVAMLTRRLLDRLHQPCEIQGASIALRVSIGVAMAPLDGTHMDALLQHADLALYSAKAQARGDFRFFAPHMATQTRRRLQIEHGLRDAMRNGELHLVYQPQIDLKHWRIVGFEALLRWVHPGMGEVSPAEFIPVAEDAGLMQEMGDWVLRQACIHASGWPEAMHVAVNVSSVQAMSGELCETIRRILEELGMPARRLELEITESVFLNESHATIQGLRSLKELGLRMALDDFGTGYSSLAHLRRFPFDTLKIDGSFVHELMSRGDARAIVRSIVALARTLNMSTVAEGVEENAQMEMLGGFGCTTVQGHFIARPMPADDVMAFIAGWSGHARPEAAQHRRTDSMPLFAPTQSG